MTERGRQAVALSPMRAAIARRMVHSKQTAPHFYVSTEIDMTSVLAAAAGANQIRGSINRVTITAFMLRAVAITLVAHPEFNAVWSGESLERVEAINIGVAIAVDGA